MTDLHALGIFSALLLASVAVGEGLRAVAGWAPESSRRTVHLGVGLATALCPPWFSEPTFIYVLAAAFIGVNAVAVRRRLLPGMHGIARRSWGTVTFPLALIAALALCWSLDASRVYVLQTAFAVLALADPAASVVGTRLARPGRYTIGRETKSVAGSAAFALVAGAVTAGFLSWLAPPAFGPTHIAVAAFAVALLGAAVEALGRTGWDNLWIVLAVIVPISHLNAAPEAVGMHALGLALAVPFGVASYRARFLDLGGTLAASVLAWMVVGLGGWAWAVPAVTFFVLSSLLSRIGRRRKARAEALAEKGSRRDAGQVVANGGVGAVLLAASVFAPEAALYWAFVGSFAAAAADTWGTEIGTLAGWPTRRLGAGPRVPPGTSGGVSLPGTLGAALGATVVVLSALPFLPEAAWSIGLVGLMVAVGVAASFVDSALGATVQARFRTAEGLLTERSTEAGTALPLARGVAWVDNDRVNLACTLVGGALAFLVAV